MTENPYAPGKAPLPQFDQAPVAEGSFALGAVLGFVFGLWGWLGCLLLAKPETKRGAGIAFLVRLVLTFLLIGVTVALG